MAYQPFTLFGASGAYSKLNATDAGVLTPTRSGSVSCLAGTCWVRLVKTPTVTASGANNALVPPAGDAFQDGWAYLTEGASMAFGAEKYLGATQTDTEPVGQIDIYIDDSATVSCIQH